MSLCLRTCTCQAFLWSLLLCCNCIPSFTYFCVVIITPYNDLFL
jgi:hypothetical protein